jgi:hypothetical protein
MADLGKQGKKGTPNYKTPIDHGNPQANNVNAASKMPGYDRTGSINKPGKGFGGSNSGAK